MGGETDVLWAKRRVINNIYVRYKNFRDKLQLTTFLTHKASWRPRPLPHLEATNYNRRIRIHETN
jgi:hypothetical protein